MSAAACWGRAGGKRLSCMGTRAAAINPELNTGLEKKILNYEKAIYFPFIPALGSERVTRNAFL